MGEKRGKVKITQEKHNLISFLKKAENSGVYAVESLVAGVAYVCADDEFAIATCNGHIRMPREDARSIDRQIQAVRRPAIAMSKFHLLTSKERAVGTFFYF